MPKTRKKPTIITGEVEMIAVDQLKTAPWNVNQADLGAISKSIEVNGFYGALVVQRSTSYILTGNHRFLAARRLGMTEVPVMWAEVNEEQAKRISLADNRTTRLGFDNAEGLVELLTELAMSDGGLLGTGFDTDDLDILLRDVDSPLDLGARDPEPDKPEKPPKEPKYRVTVDCENEMDQAKVLTILLANGFEGKAKS